MERKRIDLVVELTEKSLGMAKPLYRAKLRLTETEIEKRRLETERLEREKAAQLAREQELRYSILPYRAPTRRRPEVPLREPQVLSTNYIDSKPVVRIQTDRREEPNVIFTIDGAEQQAELVQVIDGDVYEYVLWPLVTALVDETEEAAEMATSLEPEEVLA